MSLPLMIQMQIDLTAQAHKREIAEGFAKLRAKLLPEPVPVRRDPSANCYSLYMTGLCLQAALRPQPNAMLTNNPFSNQPLQNAANQQGPLQGLGQSLFGGLGL